MRFDNGSTIYGRVWKGFNHKRDNSVDAPGGGGHTVFLDGSVNWFTWEELEAAADPEVTDPPRGPFFGFSGWPWYYFAGWAPREEE